MPSGQQFLFAPDKPLVKRLGQKFFQRIPRRPGIYKMHDVQGKIIYVGKAKDLRQRLANYRIANPEQLPKRRLRLLREVVRIEFELCPSETAALKHEAKLIRELKPKFNRAGVWQPKPRFLAWRYTEPVIEFAIQETPQPGWSRLGPLGGHAARLRSALVRLLWLTIQGENGFAGLPRGWATGELPDLVELNCGDRFQTLRHYLETDFCLRPETFTLQLRTLLPDQLSGFDRMALAADWETLNEFATRQKTRCHDLSQMTLI